MENPEQIKNLICTYQSTESYKELLTNAYDYWVKFCGLTWSKPHFTREDKPFFVPLEPELDALISKPRRKLSTLLEFLKKTGCDSREASKLRWLDINSKNNIDDIHPTKNHNARKLPVRSNFGRLT